MAVSLPLSNPQKGCKTLPVGVVASGEYQPHAQASLLPAALRDGPEDSPLKTAILAAQTGKGRHDNQQGLGKNTSKRGGYGFHQGKDTKHYSLGITKPNDVAGDNHELSSASSPAPCDKKRGKVNDGQGAIAAPTRPASARKRSNNGLRELRLSVGGKLSKLFGFSGGGGRESPPPGSPREAAVALLPWESHENLSKTLDYRPRGHGRAFLDSYEVGAVLGSGGFAVVLEGEEVFRSTTKTDTFMKASTWTNAAIRKGTTRTVRTLLILASYTDWGIWWKVVVENVSSCVKVSGRYVCTYKSTFITCSGSLRTVCLLTLITTTVCTYVTGSGSLRRKFVRIGLEFGDENNNIVRTT